MTDGLTIGSASLSITAKRAKWREAFARHELVVFFVLALFFSWYPWIIALARGQRSGPNPLGPFIAALVVAGIVEGWKGIRELLGRFVRVRFGWKWYAILFGLPIALSAIAVTIMAAFGKSISLPTQADWRELPDRFIFIFLFIGLGEEPGWRGFALPRLQKQRTPLVASLILAPIWALWHLPLMGNEFPSAVIPAFVISLLGGTLLQTWLFNRTKGSVFAQMLFHATVNTVGAGLVFPLMKGAAFVSFWYVYALLWLIAGVAVAGRLSAYPSLSAEAGSGSPQNADLRGRHPTPDRT
jgi:membrane protease YdiL (CAAX protease family)